MIFLQVRLEQSNQALTRIDDLNRARIFIEAAAGDRDAVTRDRADVEVLGKDDRIRFQNRLLKRRSGPDSADLAEVRSYARPGLAGPVALYAAAFSFEQGPAAPGITGCRGNGRNAQAPQIGNQPGNLAWTQIERWHGSPGYSLGNELFDVFFLGHAFPASLGKVDAGNGIAFRTVADGAGGLE